MSRHRLALAGVCLLAAAVYANSLANGFAMDDRSIIDTNEEVHGIDALPDAVVGPYWPKGPERSALYRPLTLATFAINWDLAGGDPFGFHLVNVLLHVAVTALVFILLVRLGAGLAGALAGSAVFAVHPVHVEAVANVVGRAEILAAAFFLLACLAYLRFRPGFRGAVVIGALYLLSLLSKEIGVTLPGALFLLHFTGGGSIRAGLEELRGRWRVYLVLALVLVGYLVLRHANIGSLANAGDAPWFNGEPASTRFWTAVRVFPEYLRLLLVPVDLVPDYGPGVIVPERSWWSPLVLLGILTAAVTVVVAVVTWTRVRLVAVGILWFAGVLFPVSNLVLPTGILLAERVLYLPSVGFSMTVAGLAAAVAAALRGDAARTRVAALVFAVVLALFGIRTWTQNPVWRDHASVARHLIEHHPANYRAQWFMSSLLKAEGRTDAALDHLRLALRMVPGYYNMRVEYAETLFDRGRWAEAAPQFDTARHITPEIEGPHVRYLESLFFQERYEDVAAVALDVTERFPRRPAAFHIRARALARLGRWDEARQARLRAIALDDGAARWAQWVHLAAIEAADRRRSAALAALDSARAGAPDTVRIPALEEVERQLAADAPPAIYFW